jgi:hypothetical protein
MFMLKRIIIASLAGLLAGCAPAITTIPTPYPPDYLPTVVALTGRAAQATSLALTPTALPTETPFPTATPFPPTTLPTWTPTPEPGFSEFAQLHFIEPGPMSKVSSPFQLEMLVSAGESGIVKIDLLGEDGRLLYSKSDRFSTDFREIYRSWKIPFEIRAVSEEAWVQVSTKDDFGRMQALNTLQIFLLSSGPNAINRPGNIIYERVALDIPEEEETISGDSVAIEGRIWPFNDQPVFLSLIEADGRPLAERVLTVDGIDPQYFETTIPYKVTEPTQVRLTIKQSDPEFNIPVYVFSRILTLNP